MSAHTFHDLDQLRAAVGVHLGHSEWVLIEQQRVDTFAESTDDRQWIHVDPERAASGPFGATIAHGYLTLSLVPALVASVVDYAGWRVKVNYGSNRVRFPAPVPVGSRVRAGLTILAVDETSAGTQLTTRVTVEVEGADGVQALKPALVAEILTLLVA